MFASLRRILSDDTPGLRAKVLGIYAVLLSVNLGLWGVSLVTAFRYPAILLLAPAAYTLGMRHAFDADHIAAIDNGDTQVDARSQEARHRRPLLFTGSLDGSVRRRCADRIGRQLSA